MATLVRHRYIGSKAFRRDYRVTVSRPSIDVPANGSAPEWKPEWRHRPNLVRFLNVRSGLRYRATVSDSELPGAHPDPYLVYERICLDWAVPDIEMDGPVLGESSRVDGLRGHDLTRDDISLMDEIALTAAEKAHALVLCNPDGLGTLAKLPLEVRAMIYEFSFNRVSEQRFWQCYHTKKAGLTLIGNTHSSSYPLICRLSTAIRKEVFNFVYREQALQIIIGTDLIVANFPLQTTLKPGQEVDAAHAEIHPSRELFIGIQFPAPRIVEGAAAVRSNLDRVVHILNGIAANQPLAPIRASFHTNAETRNRTHGYFRCDFEAYMGPLRNLRLPLRDPNLKPSQVLAIDRLANPKNDLREETCALIERAVSQPSEDSSLLTYRQSVMDVYFEMATYSRFRHNWRPLPTYWPSTQRVAAAARALYAFYNAKRSYPPAWVSVALNQFPVGGVVVDETERQRRLNVILDRLHLTAGRSFDQTTWWLEGWTDAHHPNPFWGEGRSMYWQ
jgi:hypothetical protein